MAMKIRSIMNLLGIKVKPKHYGYEIEEHDLGDKGVIRYARWQHPKSYPMESVDSYQDILNEGDFCIDIGAQVGDTSLPMGVAVGVSGCVLALEPNPFVYHVLEKNARTNAHLANIKPLFAAAADKNGFLEFNYSDAGFCNGGGHEGISKLKHGHTFSQTVYCIDLEKELQEDFGDLLPKLKYIKVDAEGNDLYILRSLYSTIKQFRPIIKAEVFKGTSLDYRLKLLSFMEELNYSVHKAEENPIRAGVLLTKNNLTEWQHYDVLCLPN